MSSFGDNRVTEPLRHFSTLLQAIGVSKRFGGVSALDRVDLRVPSSAIIGLIGPNGAGKSTMLNVISGLMAPDDGQVFIDSTDITGSPPETFAGKGVARTFQKPRLFPSLTVIDHLVLGAWGPITRGVQPRDFRRRRMQSDDIQDGVHFAVEWAQAAGIEDVLSKDVGSLSFGQSRMVEVVRALAARPKLLLMDEPASGLSPTERNDLQDLLLGLNARHDMAVLVVEHDIDFVEGVASNVFVLTGGRLLAEGTMDHLKHNQAVIDAYLGTEILHT